MTPKEYLRQYKHLDSLIDDKLSELSELRIKAEGLGRNYDGMAVRSGGDGDKLSGIVAKIIDIEKDVDNEIGALCELKREIKSVIAAVPNSEMRVLLEKRYINGYTLEKCAVEMNYSYRQILRLHGHALLAVKVPER